MRNPDLTDNDTLIKIPSHNNQLITILPPGAIIIPAESEGFVC